MREFSFTFVFLIQQFKQICLSILQLLDLGVYFHSPKNIEDELQYFNFTNYNYMIVYYLPVSNNSHKVKSDHLKAVKNIHKNSKL